MKNRFSALVCISAFALIHNAYAQDAKVLQPEAPLVLKGHKLQPYEIETGTIIEIGLETGDPGPGGMVIGQISRNVYDYYRNVAIPAGSRLIGKAARQVNNRHEVLWDKLQIPAVAGTLRLDPPLEATMPDGSTGIVGFTPGQQVGAIVSDPFIVPH